MEARLNNAEGRWLPPQTEGGLHGQNRMTLTCMCGLAIFVRLLILLPSTSTIALLKHACIVPVPRGYQDASQIGSLDIHHTYIVTGFVQNLSSGYCKRPRQSKEARCEFQTVYRFHLQIFTCDTISR